MQTNIQAVIQASMEARRQAVMQSGLQSHRQTYISISRLKKKQVRSLTGKKTDI